MNRIKAWIRFFFGFSRTETNGFIILLPLMFLIVFSQPLYRWLVPRHTDISPHEQVMLDSLVASWVQPKKDSAADETITFFRFDPNTISKDDFLKLGLEEFTVNKIVNYRANGGKFKTKYDLQKIYGMDSSWFRRAYSYIDLPEHFAVATKPAQNFVQKKSAVARFDLNAADTVQFKSIYGIGSKLASRIVKYRDKLGGFVEMSQLKEVYGLDTLVIKRLQEKSFIDDNFVPVRLKINQLGEQELAVHPYLNREKAKAITTYRFQHGAFTSLDDLNRIKLMDEKTIQRIRPYVTLE